MTPGKCIENHLFRRIERGLGSITADCMQGQVVP